MIFRKASIATSEQNRSHDVFGISMNRNIKQVQPVGQKEKKED